jgi:hypothetical protein
MIVEMDRLPPRKARVCQDEAVPHFALPTSSKVIRAVPESSEKVDPFLRLSMDDRR